MKKALILILILCVYVRLSAQELKTPRIAEHDFYVSAGTGFNYNTGVLGVEFEHLTGQRVSGYIGAGVGTWGYKLSIGTRFYTGEGRNSAFAFSYSFVTGVSG